MRVLFSIIMYHEVEHGLILWENQAPFCEIVEKWAWINFVQKRSLFCKSIKRRVGLGVYFVKIRELFCVITKDGLWVNFSRI